MTVILYLCTGLYLCFVLFIIAGLFKHNTSAVKTNNELSKVSIVVAARNEENNIASLIHDLTHQTYPRDKLEIIIANDRSTDQTGAILNKAAEKHSYIHHIQIEECNPEMASKKHALQQAIQRATGDIIVCTDADCQVPQTWVSSMASSVKSNGGITIGFSKIDGESFFDQYQMIDFLSITAANAGFGGWKVFWSGSGQNLSYEKKNFELINGFTPVKDKISGDDMYLVQAISAIDGATINIDPQSFVRTQPVKTIKDFVNQRIRWSSNARGNVKKKPWFFSFLFSAFLCNLALFSGFLLQSKGIQFAFFLKFIFEGLVIFLGGRLFETPVPSLVYLTWAVVQPFYIPFIGLLGLANIYTWKP